MQKLLLVLWFCTHHWLTETEKDKFPSSRTTYYVILQERSCKSGCWLDCDFALIIDCLKLRNARITSYGNGAHITSYCKSGRVRRIVQKRCNSCLDCDHWSWTPSKNLTGQTLSKFTEYIRLHVRPVQQLLNCETLYIYKLWISTVHFVLQPVYKISNCLRRLDWPDPGNFVGKKGHKVREEKLLMYWSDRDERIKKVLQVNKKSEMNTLARFV